MISKEQIERALAEMSGAASDAISRARTAERVLEDYTYPRTAYAQRQYDPDKRERFLAEYREADYLAESRLWIANLIRESQKKRGIPDSALCFFKDGDVWCCVNADFINPQESPAGFGKTFDDALVALQDALAALCVAAKEGG